MSGASNRGVTLVEVAVAVGFGKGEEAGS